MKPPTPEELAEMLRCARRELAYRRQCYQKWVATGRMDRITADRETKAQEMIVSYLEQNQPGQLPGFED